MFHILKWKCVGKKKECQDNAIWNQRNHIEKVSCVVAAMTIFEGVKNVEGEEKHDKYHLEAKKISQYFIGSIIEEKTDFTVYFDVY